MGLHSAPWLWRPTPPTPPPPDPDLQTGLQYLRAGWFDRAEPLFRSAHGRHGDRPDILHYLAVCLSQRGALGDAEVLWRKAIAKDPNEPMLSYNLGLVARRLGKLDEAAQRFRDTIRRAPTHVEARLALACIHIDQHRFAAAERELAEVVGNLDRALREGGPGTERLKPMQARAATCWATCSTAWATSSRALEILDMALARCRRRCRRAAPRSWATARWRWAASAATTRRSPRPSRRWRWRRRAPVLHHVLGFVLYFAGRVTEAIAPIQKALEIDPSFTRRSGPWRWPRPPPARPTTPSTLLQRALRQNPFDRDAILQLSFLHIEQKQFAEALGVLEPYLKAAPDDVRALNNQGLALRGLKRFDEARRALKRASRHVDRRSAGADQSRRGAGRSRPGGRGAVAARACPARPAGRFAPARPTTASAWPRSARRTGRARRSTTRWRPIRTTTKR